VQALTRIAFDDLGAQRVEVRMDAHNTASRRVAERNGYSFEGVLRSDSQTPQGTPRDTRIYSRVRGVEEI
jgi:RimJ/RimL family protein N-acetyltransferase